jgi:hypothetical protein
MWLSLSDNPTGINVRAIPEIVPEIAAAFLLPIWSDNTPPIGAVGLYER